MNLAERIENIGFKKGQEQGIEKGMEQGIEQGREQGQALLLLSLLEQRFGCLPADLSLRLQKANAEDVQQWSSRLFSAKSLKDVFH